MAYNKPELLLVGAARTLVLGGAAAAAYDNALALPGETDEFVW